MESKARPERVTPAGTAVQPSNPVSAPVSGMDEVQRPVEILIVDDRPENLLALEAILEPLGQIIVRASSGDEALRKLLSHNVAMILLDVQMPGINGFETAKMIKSRERTKYIPIIFLTAISKDETYVFEGYSVGAVDYMSKPFQPDVLRSKVNVFVDLFQKQRQLAEQAEPIAEATKASHARRWSAPGWSARSARSRASRSRARRSTLKHWPSATAKRLHRSRAAKLSNHGAPPIPLARDAPPT